MAHRAEGDRAPSSRAAKDVSADADSAEARDPRGLPDHYSTESLDRAFKAHLARFTLGVTPFGLASTMFDWWIHLASAPGKQVQLMEKAARKAARFALYASRSVQEREAERCIEPLPHDRRFAHPAWSKWPYDLMHQSFLLTQQWLHNATTGIDGLSERDERVVSFVARQLLDLAAPTNLPWTNPEVIEETRATGGRNLIQGARNFGEDWERAVSGKPPVGADAYEPGREVAATPGKVVFRSHLIELIQYASATETVAPEPLLIVPAWIMKYYILDLSPENSLVRHLVDQGFTVFIISWRNPKAEDRDIGMSDYIQAVGDALDAVNGIAPDRKVHAIGYCLGGTLAAIKAAQMARDGDDRLRSLVLFATQTDFQEPGELQLFISESQVSFLEDVMWDQGYLDTKQMAGAFQLLRSNDLIWSRYVHEYLMGRRAPMNDLMAWNADATRMPYRMHAEYLRRIFLCNEFAEGKYRVGAAPVALGDLDVPIFCVATTSDHVAPWRSVYKLHLLTETELTFVLTNGGHNAGIVSEPGRPGRSRLVHVRQPGDRYLSPDDWREEAEPREGSWWTDLSAWLRERSGPAVAPPSLGAAKGRHRARGDAPGTYVFQK